MEIEEFRGELNVEINVSHDSNSVRTYVIHLLGTYVTILCN